MVAADRQAIAVARDHPHVEVGAGYRESRGDRRGTPVDRVHAVRVHVVGEPTRATDAGHEDRALGGGAELGHQHLDRLEDAVVATSGTPAHLLVGRPVLLRGEWHSDVGHDVAPSWWAGVVARCSRTASIAASSSRTVNGSPA